MTDAEEKINDEKFEECSKLAKREKVENAILVFAYNSLNDEKIKNNPSMVSAISELLNFVTWKFYWDFGSKKRIARISLPEIAVTSLLP